MNLKEKAWNILIDKLENECEGNKSMDEDFVEMMEWAIMEAESE